MQKTKVPFNELGRPQQMNVLCDEMAKSTQALTHEFTKSLNIPEIENEGISIYLKNRKIYKNFRKTLLHHIGLCDLKQHFREKYKWSSTVVDYIDWYAIEGMMEIVSPI